MRRQYSSPVTRMVLTRIALGIGMLLLLSLIVFTATHALPGDIARTMLGQTATDEQVSALRSQLGLDRPLIVQYVDWLGGLFVGNFGTSLASGTPVSQLLAVLLGNTATLVLIAGAITIPLGILLGTVAARRPGSAWDVAISGTMQTILALPEFVVGILLVTVFAGKFLRLVPPTSPLDPRMSAIEQPALLILPVATMVLIAVPHLAESVKTLVRDQFAMGYTLTARLAGISEPRILSRYALPNTTGPVAQVVAITINYLLGGAVAVETVFSFPGIGSELVAAVSGRDFTVVQVITMGIATVMFVVFTLADILGILANPKLRNRI